MKEIIVIESGNRNTRVLEIEVESREVEDYSLVDSPDRLVGKEYTKLESLYVTVLLDILEEGGERAYKVVSPKGEVVELEIKQLLGNSNITLYVPKYLRCREEEVAEKIENIVLKYGDLRDIDVRERLLLETGVGVGYKQIDGFLAKVKELRGTAYEKPKKEVLDRYMVYLSDMRLESLSIELKERGFIGGRQDIVLVGGEVGELKLNMENVGYKEEAMNGVTRVVLGERVVEFRDDIHARGELDVREASKLERICYTNRPRLDLREARSLEYMEGVYNLEEELPEVDLKLPEGKAVCMIDSFNGCDLSRVSIDGRVDTEGKFDITGLGDIKESFIDVLGVSRVEGKLEGVIRESFNESRGKSREKCSEYTFDVEVQGCLKSFGVELGAGEELRVREGKVGRVVIKYTEETGKGVTGIGERTKYVSCVGEESEGDTRLMARQSKYRYWEQDYELEGDLEYLGLNGDGESITYTIRGNIGMLDMDSKVGDNVSIEGKVDEVVGGCYPIPGVRILNRLKGKGKKLRGEKIHELREGLEEIGGNVFENRIGPRYLVIPRTCERIGRLAFKEFRQENNLPVEVCVYKGSKGAKWGARREGVRVIESIEELRLELEEEAKGVELDGVYNLCEELTGYKKVKKEAYNLLEVEELELEEYLVGGVELKEEWKEYLEREGKQVDYTDKESMGNIKLYARVLSKVRGIDERLLSREVLDLYEWTKVLDKKSRGATGVDVYYRGTKKLEEAEDEINTFLIYVDAKGELVYAGLGWVGAMEDGIPGVTKYASGGYSNKVYKASEKVFTKDMEGEVSIELVLQGPGYTKCDYTVRKEVLKGEPGANILKYLLCNLKLLHVYRVKGKTEATAEYIVEYYDIVEDQVIKFKGKDYRSLGLGYGLGKGSLIEVIDLKESEGEGSYLGKLKELEGKLLRGEVYREIEEVEIGRAGVSFEFEYCRTHDKVNIEGDELNTGQLLDFLGKSKLISKLAKSREYMCEVLGTKEYANGVEIEYGVLSGSYGNYVEGEKVEYYLCVLKEERREYYNAGFDIYEYIKYTDKYVQGREEYKVDEEVCGKLVRSEEMLVISRGLGDNVCIDKDTGKYVLCLDIGYGVSVVVLGFKDVSDIKGFYKETGRDLRGVSKGVMWYSEYIGVELVDLEEKKFAVKVGNVSADSRGVKARVVNTLKYLLGDKCIQVTDKDVCTDMYDRTILRYCNR